MWRGSEIPIRIAMAYIIQGQPVAWYVKYTNKIFGRVKHENQAEAKKYKNVFKSIINSRSGIHAPTIRP